MAQQKSDMTGDINYTESRGVVLPASKSIGARYLVATYFSATLPTDRMFEEDGEDLRLIQQALLTLYADEQPIDYGNTPIDVGASGTAFRMITSVCASTPGADYVINGTERLMERPMSPLIEVLKQAGADIEILGEGGKGPYKVTGRQLDGGEFSIDAHISSQFISALMMSAPAWKKGIRLKFSTEVRSWPYVELTAKVMAEFGVEVNLTREFVEVPHKRYKDPGNFNVEADWSAAAFFYEAASMKHENLLISNLLPPEKSMQGDSAVASLMTDLGVTSHFNGEGVTLKKTKVAVPFLKHNLSDNPDLVPALVVACVMNNVKFSFSGVGNLKYKESDRLAALKEELKKQGFIVSYNDDELNWEGELTDPQDLPVDPHGDHRIAMSFAFMALIKGKIKIMNPEVVEKSFPLFWQQLSKIGLRCNTIEPGLMLIERPDADVEV